MARATSASTEPLSGDEADLLARFDAERARDLRGRLIWFCVVGMVMLLASAFGHFWEFHDAPPDALPVIRAKLPYEFLYDGLLWLLFGGTLVSLMLKLPTRRGIVGQIQRLTAGAGVVALVLEGVTVHMSPALVLGRITPSDAAFSAGVMAMSAVAVFFWLAMALIPMRWRESGVIAGVIAVGAMIALPVTIRASVAQSIVAMVVLVLVLGIGMAWSQWRFTAFDERFKAVEMKEQLRELTGEMAYARRVHEALFPPAFQRGSIRVRYKYEPMREVGGDFLFVHPESFAGLGLVPISVVLIDVSGHGIPAALTVNRLHGELQRFYGLHPTASPGELITALNTFAFHAMAPQGMFATALCLQVDPLSRELRFANAGHPPGVLRRAEGDVTDLAATATMLGVLEAKEFEAGEVRVKTPMGATVLAYTDGAFEAKNDKNEFFTIERVREFGAAAAGDRAKALVEAVVKFRSGKAQDDLLAVEVAWGEGETIMRRPSNPATRLTRMITGTGQK